MNILIVKMSSLGDVIHTLPFVKILKKHLSDSKIDWLINENYVSLVKGNPYLSEVIPFDRKWLSFSGFLKNLLVIKRWANNLKEKRYDFVFDLQGLYKSMLVLMMAHGKKNIGFSNPREPVSFIYDIKIEGDYSKHAVLRYLSLLKGIHIDYSEEDIDFYIPLSDLEKERVDNIIKSQNLTDKNFAVFAPFSRWQTKMWGINRFKKLAELFEDAGLPILFSGDRKEELGFETQRSLVGMLSVNELYYLMKKSLFVLTCDSGAMHIASAAGTKVFAIFGPTSEKRTGPFMKGDSCKIIRKDNVACAPCFKRSCEIGLVCMDMEPESLFEIIKSEIGL